jgi:hypothetical protein
MIREFLKRIIGISDADDFDYKSWRTGYWFGLGIGTLIANLVWVIN